MARRAISRGFAASAVLLALAASAAETPDRGADILGPLKTELKAALISGLEQGPEAAIAVCKEQAPAIAESLSFAGVRVGRSSHRLRNPENAAPDWLEPVLEGYLADGSPREATVVALPGERVGYVEPILLQPMCLTCHGAALAPAVAETIEREYPDDEATGFTVGDLRGVYWAEYPSAE